MKNHQLHLLLIGIMCFTLVLTIHPVSGYSHELQNDVDRLQNNQEPDDFGSVDLNWYDKPTSYAQLVNWYQGLEARYPGYIEVFKANELYQTGKTTDGYDLYYVRITNETLGFHKPEVLFLGGPHGDETVGTIGMFWFADWLMRMAFTDEPCVNYSKDWLRWLVDNREFFFDGRQGRCERQRRVGLRDAVEHEPQQAHAIRLAQHRVPVAGGDRDRCPRAIRPKELGVPG